MRDVKHMGLPQDEPPTLIDYLAELGLFLILALLAFLPFSREIYDTLRGLF